MHLTGEGQGSRAAKDSKQRARYEFLDAHSDK